MAAVKREDVLTYLENASMLEGTIGGGWDATILLLDKKELRTNFYWIDNEFFDVLGLKIKEGVDFSATRIKPAAIVNESFLKKYCSETPIGKILLDKSGGFSQPEQYVIVGVVHDFHFRSLYDKIEPLLLSNAPRTYVSVSQSLYVKYNPAEKHQLLTYLEQTWQELFPELPFRYYFLDEYMDSKYKAEERWYAIVTSASVVSLFIACLGLFGMVLISVSRRTKEIGIRKVLGASLSNMIALLSKEYMLLVLAANVIAWPLAWYTMNKWLQNFAYRIEHTGWIFLLSGLTAFIIAALTVSYQTIKTARTNPVESLRYE